MKRVVIFGAGAMACLFAARLSKASQVAIVDAWPEALALIRGRGIKVEDAQGCHTIRVDAHLPGQPVEPADLALVLVKAWQTETVAGYLNSYLRPEGLAVTLQNGLGNVEILGERAFPGATCLGATLLGPGHIRAGGEGDTQMAAPDWVVDLFRESGLSTRRCDANEAESLLWGKLCASCGINPLTALLRVTNGELLKRSEAYELLIKATGECAAIAQAKGLTLPFSDPADYVRNVAERTANNRSSMLQDILRGAPTECDAINGAVAREGRRIGKPAPVNETLWQLIRAFNYHNRSRFGNADS
jgi:2-dehydropantoate 2-reductase